MSPLNWPALVAEAKRRRAAEGMTQKFHASLAGVSVPTMVSFDRGDEGISIGKALAILEAVGLTARDEGAARRAAFVRTALDRWEELVDAREADDPARLNFGTCQIDYQVAWDGPWPDVRTDEFTGLLKDAVVRLSGWPPFWFPTKRSIAPQAHRGLVECWLGRDPDDRAFYDAAHVDYWLASPEGRLFLLRGFEEDASENFPPGQILDVGLPIRRMAEVLAHAVRFAALRTAREDGPVIGLECRYSGIRNRRLRRWANPLRRDVPGTHAGTVDEVELRMPPVEIGALREDPVGPIHELLAPLYGRFGFHGFDRDFVEDELEDLLPRWRVALG